MKVHSPPITKKCGAWMITLQELVGKPKWRAYGTKFIDYELAHGDDDPEEALANFAEKVGLNRHDVLRTFEL